MTQLRVELKLVVEYDADPENYGTSDRKTMAQIDYDQWIDAPHLLAASFDLPEDASVYELSVGPA